MSSANAGDIRCATHDIRRHPSRFRSVARARSSGSAQPLSRATSAARAAPYPPWNAADSAAARSCSSACEPSRSRTIETARKAPVGSSGGVKRTFGSIVSPSGTALLAMRSLTRDAAAGSSSSIARTTSRAKAASGLSTAPTIARKSRGVMKSRGIRSKSGCAPSSSEKRSSEKSAPSASRKRPSDSPRTASSKRRPSCVGAARTPEASSAVNIVLDSNVDNVMVGGPGERFAGRYTERPRVSPAASRWARRGTCATSRSRRG